MLTTFITSFGKLKFNRHSFRISSAPENFQRKISEILSVIEGMVGLIHDLFVFGRTKEEHYQRLMMVLQRLQEAGVSLNQNNCQFYTNNISFLGHVVNEIGMSPDLEKTKAIIISLQLTNIVETQQFLGMLNEHSKFSQNLSEKTKPIRDLLSKKCEWYWGDDQEKVFQELKESLCAEGCLALCDPKWQTIMSADASAYGLGAVLCRKQPDVTLRPVVYIFRSMTETEQR
uniref:Reverse transcriptase/retrotransposon-derived protein RNase H-like domain-containing protein n=1 Tax=Amphimedon queenslandica TaxID=400682 RepID=A0A1X7SRG5_AMPQE